MKTEGSPERFFAEDTPTEEPSEEVEPGGLELATLEGAAACPGMDRRRMGLVGYKQVPKVCLQDSRLQESSENLLHVYSRDVYVWWLHAGSHC